MFGRLLLVFIALLFHLESHAMTNDEALVLLKSIAFPLYEFNLESGRQCVGFNALPNKTGDIAYDVSAGHCENSYYYLGERGLLNFPILGKVNDGGRFEFLYSMHPVCNKTKTTYLPLRATIDTTKSFFTLAQTSGTEAFEKVGVVKMLFVRDDPKRGLVFRMVCPAGGCTQFPSRGLSGSPVIDDEGSVIGIMKGAWAMEPHFPLATALAPILPFLESVAADTSTINRSRYCRDAKSE